MDSLVIQAYGKALSNNLFSVTKSLEIVLKKRYSALDPRFNITTRQVENILRKNGLPYSICG